MSWEEMKTYSATCPCGKGKITQKSYGDDWNRFKNGPVIIECIICSKKYRVEENVHHGMLASDGTWSTYYLIPYDYPKYSGIKETDLYSAPVSQYEAFSDWLIENYTKDVLKDVLERLRITSSSAKLTGVAARIRDFHRKAKGTVRVSEIIKTVETSLKKYSGYIGNKIQRDDVRKKENEARAEYLNEKRKHQLEIDLK